MTPLQQVHLRIQEINKEYGHIPINILMQEFEDNAKVIAKYIDYLIILEYIYFADSEKQKVRLTEIGKLANIP